MAKRLQEQQAVRPGVLIAVAAIGALAVGFFVVNLLVSHGGKPEVPSNSTSVTAPGNEKLPNFDIPTAPPAPPSSGRDPFQPVAGAAATPAPVAAAAPAPAPTAAPAVSPEFKDTTAAGAQYVQLISVAADQKSAQIRDGSIVYEQARPGQTLDRNVVFDSIDADGQVHLHRGSKSYVLAKGQRILI